MAERVMVGTGSCDKDGIREVTRRWDREAKQGQPRVKPQRLAPDMMGGMGIGYRVVKQKHG